MFATKKRSLESFASRAQCVLLLIACLLLLVTGVYVCYQMKDYHAETLVKREANVNKSAELTRQAREVLINTTQSAATNNKNYYEEQNPVVVHAESGPIMGYPQPAQVPPQLNSESDSEEYRDPIYGAPVDYGPAADDQEDQDYYARERYYDNSENENSENAYERPSASESASASASTAESGSYEESAGRSLEEGRGMQQARFGNYYSPWHYATPSPIHGAAKTAGNMNANRKLQNNGHDTNRYGHIYGLNYNDALPEYGEYVSAPAALPTALQKQRQPQTQQRVPNNKNATPTRSGDTQLQFESSESTLMTVLRSLKVLWDIYHAFAAAWNAMAEQKQKQQKIKQEQQQQQQQQQHQQQKNAPVRINSKRPSKFEVNNNNNNKNNNNKNPTKNNNNNNNKAFGKTTTTTTTTAISSITTESPPAKVEPRKRTDTKGDVGQRQQAHGSRARRGTDSDNANNNALTDASDTSEGRYIKGDPLKGYYDFIITEGSYKFWAVFQVGTALLIIYSTFAAIYYSKVNPLVSDYDYTDYLGGGRSLSGGDLDFVDDTTNDETTQPSKPWYDWVPRMGHSVQFILDSIDKLPVDHAKDNTDTENSPEVTEYSESEPEAEM